MSFYDLPTVDKNSKISEESVIAVRSYFTRRNGFILRIDDPDYGCDVTMELIAESSGASGQRFPAQIKSSASLSFIKKQANEFISLNILTSRLGYLCRQPPAYGIILIYDDQTKTCYFDYVEAIINRLIEERQDEEWKKQHSVSIHLPKENVLNGMTVSSIHQRFSNRFEAHCFLVQKHGMKYDIPNFSQISIGGQEELSAADLLKKYSSLLLDDYDISRLYQLLSQVPFQELISSKELILIAAVTYSEMGRCLEGEFYLNKSEQIINQFSQGEIEILKFTRIKIDFLLGKRSKKEFHDDLKSMQEIIQQPHNALQIQINLFYYEVLEQIERNEFNDLKQSRMLLFFQEVDKAKISEKQKHTYKVFHSENLHMFVSSRMLKYVTQLRLRESLGAEISNQDRINTMQQTNSTITFLTTTVLDAYRYAKKEEDRFLKAHCHYALSRFYMMKEYDFMLLNFKDSTSPLKENYRRAFLQAVEAHNLFLGLGLLKEAYRALQNAYELNRLSKLWHEFDVTEEAPSEEILRNNLKAAEKEMGITKSYVSIVDNAFAGMQKTQQATTGELFKDLSDEQVETFASNVLNAYNLPKERHIHIVNEIKAYRFFHQHCDTKTFELFCNLAPHQNPVTKYAAPTSFIMVSKRTGLESKPGYNIEEMAKSFGAIKIPKE